MRSLYSFFLCMLLACVSAPALDLGPGGLSFGVGADDSAGPFGFSLAESDLVQASLVPGAPAAAPGQPFPVLLRLAHSAGAYSYWINPAGPGVAAEMEWHLPPGATVSEPQWPAPERKQANGVTSYVLQGTTALVYMLTLPADVKPGALVTVSATLVTQVCTSKTCMPLRLPLALEVPVAAQAAPASEQTRLALARMPADLPEGWAMNAAAEAGRVVLTLRPGQDANPEPGAVYFYDAGSATDTQEPQEIRAADGVWTLALAAREGAPAAELRGVLHADNGWMPNGPKNIAITARLGADALPAAQAAAPGAGETVLLLLFAFFGGLLLNVMPCVFPVLSLKIMGFARQAHQNRKEVFWHGAAYTAGVLVCFWALAVLVISTGWGWGAQLQQPWFVLALCHVFLALSLNMAGVFEVGTRLAGASRAAARSEGLRRSFLSGLLATITSTPCSAPFLGTALAYALSLPPVLALGVFTLMGIGFGFPYLALSLFPGWLKILPKPGRWMETFRQAMSFPLFATTAYMCWVMEAMLDEGRFLMLLFGLVFTAFGCWLYGMAQKSALSAPRRLRVLSACALLALAAGVWISRPARPAGLEWEPWSPERAAQLRREGRPVYVDFTARWCATCQVNKRVYANPRVIALLEDRDVALLRADWTKYDQRITDVLRREFNKAAVPVTVLYRPGEPAAYVFPELLTAGMVAEQLENL